MPPQPALESGLASTRPRTIWRARRTAGLTFGWNLLLHDRVTDPDNRVLLVYHLKSAFSLRLRVSGTASCSVKQKKDGNARPERNRVPFTSAMQNSNSTFVTLTCTLGSTVDPKQLVRVRVADVRMGAVWHAFRGAESERCGAQKCRLASLPASESSEDLAATGYFMATCCIGYGNAYSAAGCGAERELTPRLLATHVHETRGQCSSVWDQIFMPQLGTPRVSTREVIT